MRNKLALICTLLPLVSAGTALGYSYETCDGEPVRFAGMLVMYRDRCSMPDGTPADAAYWNAGVMWWNAINEISWNFWYEDDCYIGYNNGYSQTAIVPQSMISGLNGTTHKISYGCWWPLYRDEIQEADVMLSADLDYTPDDETTLNWTNEGQGRTVILHEWGHAMGLKHTTALAQMNTGTPHPLAGGGNAEPFPDDVAGVHFLYMYAKAGTNVLSSAQRRNSDGTVQRANEWTTVSRCPGQTVNVRYTIANTGTTTMTQVPFRVGMSTSNVGSGIQGYLFNGSASLGPKSYFTEERTLTVPNLPPATYHVLWGLDWTNSVAEYNETDNTVRSGSKITIPSGCP
jgi:hypothetical protein